jgi:hypothetical protein
MPGGKVIDSPDQNTTMQYLQQGYQQAKSAYNAKRPDPFARNSTI